jgi:hypothetical protein
MLIGLDEQEEVLKGRQHNETKRCCSDRCGLWMEATEERLGSSTMVFAATWNFKSSRVTDGGVART